MLKKNLTHDVFIFNIFIMELSKWSCTSNTLKKTRKIATKHLVPAFDILQPLLLQHFENVIDIDPLNLAVCQ